MKKLIDDRQTLVADMLEGYVRAYPQRVRLAGEKNNLLCRAQKKEQGKVGVLIGNGCGHEPAMIDLVGKGLFDVNVCGDIFTAPPPFEMLEGIQEADCGEGVLVLVSSHQGDILNAKMAVMLAEAEGITAKMFVLYDDIASAPPDQPEERRGTAGLFFCFKMICAAAERGCSLEECIDIARKARDSVRTLSVAVSAGTNPVTSRQTFELPDDEIEVGMGVHGEAGQGRIKLPTARELSAYLLERLIADRPYKKGEKVMVLLNSMGATTRMELMILFRNVAQYLRNADIELVRSWVGIYVTTQEMAGFALSLCAVDDRMLELFDEPAQSPLFNLAF